MKFGRPRLAVAMLGNHLGAAVIRRNQLDTFVIDAETPAAALRAELDARGLRPRTVAIGLARAAVTVKPIDLPAVAGEMREMVKFELERHLPFAADDAPFDFLPLPVEAEPDRAPAEGKRVLIAAADRRVVDAALRLAEEAGLRPVSITVAAHDLLALVETDRRHRVAWLHRAGDAADLLLLQGGRLVFSRSLPATDDGTLVAEIRRSFTVARWRDCDAVWVSGDGAATTALLDLGVPVSEPPWTAHARRRLAAIAQAPRGALELALATASGRGIRPLDLIPPAIKPRRLTRPQKTTVGVLAATVLLAIAALLVPGYVESRRLAALNAEITRIDPEVRAVERVVRELERKRQRLTTIDGIRATAIRPLPVLRELTEILPADAWLTYLAFDPKGVELTGQAAAASTLIPLLENSPRLERVEFASPVTRGRDREQFRIRAAWEAPAPPPATPASAPGAPPAARARDAKAGNARTDEGAPPAPVPGQPPR